MEHYASVNYAGGMDGGEVTPEQIEAEFHGWVAWATANGWHARQLKEPQQVLHAGSGEDLRRQIRAHLAQAGG